MSEKIYEIKLVESCWGGKYYFGYINGRQYTEDFCSIDELIEKYPNFKKCSDAVK